jgi:hypothetical protein
VVFCFARLRAAFAAVFSRRVDFAGRLARADRLALNDPETLREGRRRVRLAMVRLYARYLDSLSISVVLSNAYRN